MPPKAQFAREDGLYHLFCGLVISNIITANPFIGRGVVAKWGTEFIFSPIHGWAGVNTLVGLFTKSLRRHARLDPLGLDPVWTAGVMPSAPGDVIPLSQS
jgi:light-independent protochlorophyllide reductase subunit N